MSTPWAEGGSPAEEGPSSGRGLPPGSRAPSDPGATPGGDSGGPSGEQDQPRGIFRPGATARLLSPRVLRNLRILLTLLTLAMVILYLRSRPSLDFSGFAWRWDQLALAAALLPPLLWLRAAKWRLLLRGLAPGVTLGESLRSYLGSMALAMVTPGRVGELSRGLYLPHPRVQGWKGAGLVLLDSWTDFLAVALWACVGLHDLWGAAGLSFGLAFAAVFLPIPLWLRLVPVVLSRLPSRWGFRAWAARALPAPGDVGSGDLLRACLVGLLAYGLEWIQVLLLLRGVAAVDPSLLTLAGGMALVTLANSVQVTVGGIGVREGMAMVLLAGEGIGPEAAALAAFLQSVLILVIPALAGLAVKPVRGAEKVGNQAATRGGAGPTAH